MSATRLLTITEFLSARIAEDAQDAEAEAKRQIVQAWEAWAYHAERDSRGEGAMWETSAAAMNAVLRALAGVYADHPDYREEWRR
jgi:hypothetical protein